MRTRGRLPNVSFFAFTATPKAKTLELFGTKRADGKFEAFSIYSMRQAIEEGFIRDVLENYTTYKVYWNLLKKIEADPRYDRSKATVLLTSFVGLHEHTINKKVSIMVDYVRLYAFVSQVISFVDTDLEKLYVFGRLLLRKLPISRDRLPVEIYQSIDIESYRIQQTGKGKITLPRGTTEIDPIGPKDPPILLPDELEPLSQIIKRLNEHFGTDFSEEDKICIRELEQRLEVNAALEASIRANTPENARLTFNHVVSDLLQDMIEGHFKFYKQVTDDETFARFFLDWLFERYYARKSQPPDEPTAK
jgi:hypothetical protein